MHCLVSNREGLGMILKITGLASIDPHSRKEHTEIHKIPKFGVNQAGFDWKKCMASGRCVGQRFKSLYLSQN